MSKRIFSILLFSIILLSASSVTFAQTCAAPSAGLSNFWTGDNSTNDFVGTNYGTLQNGAGYTLNGRVGTAFNLNEVFIDTFRPDTGAVVGNPFMLLVY